MAAQARQVRAVAEFEAVAVGASPVDRHEVFARCRADAPVFYSDALGFWILSRYADVRGALEDETRFRSLVDEPGASLQRTFLQMTGREHNKKAGTVARRIRAPRAFTEGLEEAIRSISAQQAAQLPMGEPVDVKRDYAMWIPLLVITELTDVREAGRFRDWYQRIASGGVASVSDPAARASGLDAVQEVREFLAPIIAERRGSDATDLVTTLAGSSYDGVPLSDEEIVSTVTFLLTAGVETTERALASLLRHLLLRPDHWSALAGSYEDRSFVASLSAETVRYFPPVQALTRRATETVVLHDTEVPGGDRVLMLLASANRDEDEFTDPQRFDPGRFGDQGDQQFATASRIMPFGAGRHHCTGSRLAASEMINAITEFCRCVSGIEPAGELPPSEGFMLRSPPAVPMILRAA